MSFDFWRVVYTFLIFISIVFLPWYIYLPLLCVGTFVFKHYYVAVIGAVVSDLLFGFNQGSFLGSNFSTTIIVGVIFILSLLFRDKLRFIYDRT